VRFYFCLGFWGSSARSKCRALPSVRHSPRGGTSPTTPFRPKQETSTSSSHARISSLASVSVLFAGTLAFARKQYQHLGHDAPDVACSQLLPEAARTQRRASSPSGKPPKSERSSQEYRAPVVACLVMNYRSRSSRYVPRHQARASDSTAHREGARPGLRHRFSPSRLPPARGQDAPDCRRRKQR
jgi:hypothetical protein